MPLRLLSHESAQSTEVIRHTNVENCSHTLACFLTISPNRIGGMKQTRASAFVVDRVKVGYYALPP